MVFLLSNDDGVRAPGLAALREALEPWGRCIVVAPEGERSASGHAFTMHRPLRLRRLEHDVYSVDGSPADAVYVGLHHVCPEPPDLVVAGINRGANICQDIFYSGTVAAAMEGAMAGFPAVAASLFFRRRRPTDEHHWDVAGKQVQKVCGWVIENGLPPGTVLNLNVPDVPARELRGLKTTCVGRHSYRRQVEERKDPRGRSYLWLGGEHWRIEPVPGSDGIAVRDRYASVTPLQMDLTATAVLPSLEEHFGAL